MTRIVYSPFIEGGYITKKMLAIDFTVQVLLSIEDNKVVASFYKNDSRVTTFKKIEDENVTSLKKKVKKELISLGVNFSYEVRPNLKHKLKGEKK